tara:strand:- start:2351 stop:2542 length:192 start_codon:yes stop_codon:yes gene_type:complete
MHLKKNNEKLEKLISKLDEDRAWLLKNIDKGKWPELRMEIAQLEREISKFILRAKEINSEIKS